MLSDVIISSALYLLTVLASQSEANSYASSIKLDFLCSSAETSAYVRDIPWDCSSYVICLNGQAMFTSCPAGKLYGGANINSKCDVAANVDASRCHGAIWNYIQLICQHNPTATVINAEKCGQYFDCSVIGETQDFVKYLLECPYPHLYSKDTGRCQNYRFVACGEREEPKAPCDYFQYLQLYNCTGSDCGACKHHHPSCLGLNNGRHQVPNRSDVIMECEGERTISLIRKESSTRTMVKAPETPVMG